MVVLGQYIGKLLRIRSPYFALMMTGFEMGMFGYAVFVSFQGEAHLGKIALIDLGQVVFVFTILMALMIKHRDGAAKGSDLLKKNHLQPCNTCNYCWACNQFHCSPRPELSHLGYAL